MTHEHPIPTVHIYGQKELAVTPDLLHCEPLIIRSREHKFEIKPHRHHGLSQIFYLKRGHGEANIDGDPTTVKAPCLIVISEMSIHDFIWSDDVEGSVLSIANPLLESIEKSLNQEQPVIKATLIMTVRREQHQLESILDLLHFEYSHAPADSRALVLSSLMQLLAIWLERNAPDKINTASQQNRTAEYFNQFMALINRDFIEHRKIESYASELGITAPYLNLLCQQLVEKSALQLVHERVILEAKRNLIYTVQNISEIAYGLGFTDPAYFTRFFRRLTEQSPKQFRVKQNTQTD
ncbi:MAG: helix-turn-helix domain-containing protein [Amphritea sp.]|nr:helix-turn-helix domain-containing protein [Amphritea sp.]